MQDVKNVVRKNVDDGLSNGALTLKGYMVSVYSLWNLDIMKGQGTGKTESSPVVSQSPINNNNERSAVKGSARDDGKEEREEMTDKSRSSMADKSNGRFIGNENENLTDRLLHQAYIGHKLPCLHISCRSAAGRIKICLSSLLSPFYLALVPFAPEAVRSLTTFPMPLTNYTR